MSKRRTKSPEILVDQDKGVVWCRIDASFISILGVLADGFRMLSFEGNCYLRLLDVIAWYEKEYEFAARKDPEKRRELDTLLSNMRACNADSLIAFPPKTGGAA